MRSGHVLYDAHAHIGHARHSGRRYSADDLLLDMDRLGIDKSLLIPFPVVEDESETHEEIGRAVGGHRDRFAGAACLNPFCPEHEYRDKVRRCREEYGFVALKLQPQYQALNPLLDRNRFVFETAIENNLPLIWHTGSGIPYALPSLLMLPAREYPDLCLVLSHCGGGGLLLGEAMTAAAFCPNVYLELSSLMPNHILEVLQRITPDRLMIGSDLPENAEIEFAKILSLPVTEDTKREILAGTALRVFGEAC